MKKLTTIMSQAKGVLALGLFVMVSSVVSAQNYTSNGNGAWTTPANWTGGTAPPTSGQTNGTNAINHNLSITGAYSFSGSALNIAASRTLSVSTSVTLNHYGTSTINGTLSAGTTLSITNGTTTIASGATVNVGSDFSISSGATLNVYGSLNITGNATFSSTMNIHPGGVVTINGNTTINSANYLIVGTNVNPPAYADLVMKGNLTAHNGGDMTLNRNARVALFGNYASTGSGGNTISIANGAQIYIHGNMGFYDSSSTVTNGNPSGTGSVRGFYVEGSVGSNGTVSSNRGNRAFMQTNDPPFYAWVAGLSGSPLPVTLSAFKIEQVENTVLLTWSTSSEKNFDKFVVERSSNGQSFEAIGEIKGAGNSKVVLNYSFTDSNPLLGTNYYRLRQVDFDLFTEYSKVVFTVYNDAKRFKVFPNPSNGESIDYLANFEPTAGDVIVIIDQLGAQVSSATVEGVSGTIAFQTTLKAGTYLIKYISHDYQTLDRLVVR